MRHITATEPRNIFSYAGANLPTIDAIAMNCIEGRQRARYVLPVGERGLLERNRTIENPDFPFWLYDGR